jgi:hypothetical protein
MMDGRVGALRAALDEHGLSETPIIAYSAKFASAFYGPFREAADSAPQSGDRRGYQMDPANAREAVREALLDRRGGRRHASWSSPRCPYLDVIRRVRESTDLPVAAYNVSGRVRDDQGRPPRPGLLDERAAVLEALTGIRRRAPTSSSPTTPRTSPDGFSSPAQGALAQGRLAIPLDDTDRKLLNLMQGSFDLVPRPFAHVAKLPRSTRPSDAARPAPARRPHHPRDHADLRHARARLQLDARRAKVDPEYPHRAAKFINTHPGVTHNYLRNHDFNLWFTLATEPDSQLGLEGTLDVMAERPARSRSASCRR